MGNIGAKQERVEDAVFLQLFEVRKSRDTLHARVLMLLMAHGWLVAWITNTGLNRQSFRTAKQGPSSPCHGSSLFTAQLPFDQIYELIKELIHN